MKPPKIGSTGENHMTWRNDIALKAIKEKELGNFQNPKRIQKRWKRYQDQNFIQNVQPLKTFFPDVLKDLRDILKKASEKNLKVKAVGSGHSFSDIMTTPDYLVTTHLLEQVLMSTGNNLSPREINSLPFLNPTIIDHGYTSYLKETEKAKIDPSLDDATKDVLFQEIEDRIDKLTPSLYEIEAGIKIEDLNKYLWSDGFSLQNMGTYQGQTFLGAVSTSTHGSGINLGPLPDMIKSLVIVTEGGVTLRIEPKGGISQPQEIVKHTSKIKKTAELTRLIDSNAIFISKEPNVDFLIQDDDWFNSSLVNVGCFGVIYSVIIEVVPRFHLLETVEIATWNNLKKRLSASAEDIFKTKAFPKEENKKNVPEELHVSDIYQTEIIFNPHKLNGKNYCRITRRYKIDYEAGEKHSKLKYEILPNGRKEKVPVSRGDVSKGLTKVILNLAAEKPENNSNDIKKITQAIFRRQGKAGPASILNVLKDRLVTDNKSFHDPGYYVNRNYAVYINPTVGISGYGVETAFSMKEKYPLRFNGKEGNETSIAYITAIDHSIKIADQHFEEGKFNQTAPTAVRFVKASRAYLSPQYGEDTVMIENLNLSDTHGGKELFYRYQSQFFQYGGRPHWGLDLSVTTGNNNLLEKMYPKFKQWKAVYDTLNANGTFNNRFTDRMGLSIQDFYRKPI